MDDHARLQVTSRDRVHDAWLTHHERLWRSLLAWSGDREIASDAVAEAFAQAARRGEAVDDVGRWVWRAAFRIAGGLLADGRRRRGGPPPTEPADPATLPDDAVALIDALDHLRPSDRQIVVLSLVGGWPAADIGRLTSTQPGTVRVRLHRAKAQLRTLLEDHDA